MTKAAIDLNSLLKAYQPELDAFNARCQVVYKSLKNLHELTNKSAEFTAIKFENYLEVDRLLFSQLPELRATCREATCLCKLEPRLSTLITTAVAKLQAMWLAVEERLSEYKSHRSLLMAMSGDLKYLPLACREHTEPSTESGKPKHVCCTQKIEQLSSKVQKKDKQLQQVLNVTSAVSKVLDLVCDSSEPNSRQESRSSRGNGSSRLLTMSSSSVACAVGLSSTWQQQQLNLSSTTTTSSTEKSQVHQAEFLQLYSGSDGVSLTPGTVSSTDSTTYDRRTDCDRGDRATTSESSEILMQTGHNSALHRVASAMNSRRYERNLPRRSYLPAAQLNTESSNSTRVKFNCSMMGEGCCSGSSSRSSHRRSSSSSRRLRAIGQRIAELTDSAKALHASALLTASSFAESAAEQIRQLEQARKELEGWQTELGSLSKSLTAMEIVCDKTAEAAMKRAHVERLALLSNWMASLRDRCLLRVSELRRRKC